MTLMKRKIINPYILLGLLFLLVNQSGCAHQRRVARQHPDSYRSKPWSLVTAGIYQTVIAGDLNGDQHPDIAGGSSVPGTVAIWYGDGKGGWSSPFFLPTNGDVRSIALADFDRDGRPDLALSMLGDNPGIQLWLNRGRKGWKSGSYYAVLAADPDAAHAVALSAAGWNPKVLLDPVLRGCSHEPTPTSDGVCPPDGVRRARESSEDTPDRGPAST